MFEHMAVSRFEAAGVLAFFYEATQDAELVRASVAEFEAVARVKLKPYRVADLLVVLVEAGLADDHGDGTYTIRGNEAHVAKLRTYRDRAAKGGHIRARKQLEAAGKQLEAATPAASSSPGDWRLDQDPGSNTPDPPPASAGVPPKGGPLSLDGLRESANREQEARAELVTIEQAKAMQQPGRDTETNARATRQLEPFALAVLAELCDAATPPIVRPSVWDRQDHRYIAKLVGKYPAQEQWRAILSCYVTDPRWAFLGGARSTKFLAENIDDIAGRALGAAIVAEDPIAAGLRDAQERERAERERKT